MSADNAESRIPEDVVSDNKPTDCGDVEVTSEIIEVGIDEFYGHPIIADEPTRDEVCEAIIATYKAMVLACRRGLTEV